MGLNFNDADYDIGHVFHYLDFGNTSWASGGIAGVGVVCDDGTFFSTASDSDGSQGQIKQLPGVVVLAIPINSWIQLAAHEFGHQFDALHTFNGNGNGNCNGAISSSTAYEIGSGTTIMSYNGLCSASQNVPSNGEADNYFHSSSLDRMQTYISSTDGNCAISATNGNSIPTITSDFNSIPIIPIGTPFELDGNATDIDGDALSYLWEQIDEDGLGTPTHGFIGSAAANSDLAPLFKSVPPSENSKEPFHPFKIY